MIIFIKTEHGKKTSVKTDFILLSKSKFQEEINLSSKGIKYLPTSFPKYRYAYLDNLDGAKLLNRMTLQEYEREFGTISLSKESINLYFRKEISEKYGK